MSEGQRVIEWRPFDKKEFPSSDRPSDLGVDYRLPVGYVAKDRRGKVWLVGGINEGGYDPGCGCCSKQVDIIEIADLTGDVEGLRS